jgi:hypothetical protein
LAKLWGPEGKRVRGKKSSKKCHRISVIYIINCPGRDMGGRGKTLILTKVFPFKIPGPQKIWQRDSQ